MVRWRGEVPTWDRIRCVIEGYCGGADYDFSRYPWAVIFLAGYVSFEFRGLGHPREAVFDEMHPPEERRRIEVFIHEPSESDPGAFVGVGVITRHADRFTRDVADGLARVFCEAFDGAWE